ncbi:MAG: hypothetical protein ABSB63_13620 [Spirochaetia bacterium]|jgi:hypothetical protein
MIRTHALTLCCALLAVSSWGIGSVSIDSPRVDVPFDSDIVSPGLVVHTIRVSTHAAMTSFFIDYESDVTRGFLLFDPPDGKAVRIEGAESLPPGRHEARIDVETARLAPVERISIWILGGAADSVSFALTAMPQTPEVPEGPQGRLQASDARALAASGVTLGTFTFQPAAGGELTTREYVRNGVVGSDNGVEQAVAGAIDSLHARMPSLKDIVKEFGPPARVVVSDDVGTRSYSAHYGRVQLYFIDSLEHLEEIRLQSAEPAYRLAQNIGVGSSLGEVLAALGQPLARSADTRMDFPGVRFFFNNGVVTAMYLVGSGQSSPGSATGGKQDAPSGGEQEGSDSWGPEDIFTIP